MIEKIAVQRRKLDIGCGPRKAEGFEGMDLHAYPGVDHVHDIDSDAAWPFRDSQFDELICRHVIEHVRNLKRFFVEIHRISRDGARVRIETPHYSSRNSWGDPTHIHHLSVNFCQPFLSGYLSDQFPKYSIRSRKITFGSFLHTWPAQLYCKLLGYDSYEKHLTWIFPASSVIVELQVHK